MHSITIAVTIRPLRGDEPRGEIAEVGYAEIQRLAFEIFKGGDFADVVAVALGDEDPLLVVY